LLDPVASKKSRSERSNYRMLEKNRGIGVVGDLWRDVSIFFRTNSLNRARPSDWQARMRNSSGSASVFETNPSPAKRYGESVNCLPVSDERVDVSSGPRSASRRSRPRRSVAFSRSAIARELTSEVFGFGFSVKLRTGPRLVEDLFVVMLN
jgi:hypothetical protein